MIRPIKDKIAAKKIVTNDLQQKHGLFVPNESYRDDRYTVLAIGPDVKEIIPGDIVYILPNSEHEIATVNDERLTFIKEKNIYGVED